MPKFPEDCNGSITDAIEASVAEAIPGASVKAEGGGGHFVIEVESSEFDGKNRVQQQRMVLRSIKHLMSGDAAPVHAVDAIRVLIP